MKSCHKKSKLYKNYRQYSIPDNKKKYTVYRNKLKSLLRKAEKKYYINKFNVCARDIRKTWDLIGAALNQKKPENTINCFTVDGVQIDNKVEIVEKFNNYFTNIGSNLASSIPPSSKHFLSYLGKPSPNSMSLFLTDPNEIIQIVSGFQNKNGAGYDDIPVSVLKSSIVFVAKPISELINCSFRNSIFPDDLKIKKICSIYKYGEKSLFNNNKPILYFLFFLNFRESTL